MEVSSNSRVQFLASTSRLAWWGQVFISVSVQYPAVRTSRLAWWGQVFISVSVQYHAVMRGSQMFCQRGYNSDNVLFIYFFKYLMWGKRIQIPLKSGGAQWLSGRELDSRPRGRRFEPHRRHCVVSLSKNINPSLVLVQPRKTRPFITERLLMGRKESKQTNKLKSGP